ncbi:hypothetical protein P389DRAFT_164911 [Cystobasidium minutum MCA 4210]|uniref:uncharacterized protein n=1 Tax=Cystobasidium minutum MCA 4210 TaxID=1397322 RepID=UPI0034CD886E|eukprot:jgi/Rhomi1/164911/fgenesh1_kg.1_\
MRALLRTVTGSPASIKGKAKQGKAASQHYGIGDIASSWTNIKNVLAASATIETSDHASTSTDTSSQQQQQQAVASLSRSLDIIVDGLVNEQSTLSSDDAGPCLEYVLTNNVFSNIAQAAVLDQPVGLLGLVIRAFDNLVILLGEAFVTFGHRSLNDLLHGCIIHEIASNIKHAPSSQAPSNAQLKIKHVAEPYEEELASLACSLCSRIKTQPDLLPLFFHDKRLSYRSKNAPSSSEGKQNTTTIHVVQHDDQSAASAATSPGSSSAFLSPRPSLSQSSSQASISSTTSASDVSVTSPPGSSTAPTTQATVESSQYTFLIFDFLIRLLHRHGRIGELARTGLLFIIDLAMSDAKVKISPPLSATAAAPPPFPILSNSKARSATLTPSTSSSNANPSKRSSRRPKRKAVIGQSDRISLLSYIEDSDFADVLSAGLGAAFAVLPSHLYVPIPSMSTSHPEEVSSLHSPTLDASHDGPAHSMREHGIAISTDHEVKEGLELFVSIIDFATDVTRKAPKKQKSSVIDASCSQDTSQASSSMSTISEKMRSLISSIQYSFGTVFLHNALLPRVVDAASPTAEDAAIIAVLTYIDTMINALEVESPLFEETVSSLLAATGSDNGTSTPSRDNAAMRDNLRRVLSYSLSTHSGPAADPIAASLSHSLQLSALRLLYTLLEKADWAALHLFNIQPCIGCTSFPFQVYQDVDAEDAAFTYPGDEDESDQDSFIYPSEDDHRKSIAAFTAANAAQSRSRKTSILPSKAGQKLELFLQLVSNPASTSNVLGSPSVPAGNRKNLSRHSSNSSFDAPRHLQSATHSSMSFSKYVRQAELGIQKNQSFIRGLAVQAATESEASGKNDSKTVALKSPAIHLGDMSLDSATSSHQSVATTASTFDGQAEPVEDRMIQHKLPLHLGLMARLDALLSTFFINEPAVNLSLTRVLAKLAMCPYRSLEDWFIAEEAGGTLQALQSLLIIEKIGLVDSAQDSLALQHSPLHQRSDNSKVTDWLRQSSYAQRTPQQNRNPDSPYNDDTSILVKYANLLNEVEEVHREQIKDFDRLLHERRQNMLFVDDLADAMQGDGTSAHGGSPMEASSSSWHAPLVHMARMPGTLVSSPRRARQRVDSSATERDYVNSLSPYAAHVRETSSKQIVVRLPVTADEGPSINSIDGVPLSRFWSAASANSDHGQDAEAEATIETSRSPTFGLSPTTSSRLGIDTNLMLLSDLKSPMTPDLGAEEQKYKEVAVNLSKYLDNLVILEESLKELIAIVAVRMRIGIDPIQ